MFKRQLLLRNSALCQSASYFNLKKECAAGNHKITTASTTPKHLLIENVGVNKNVGLITLCRPKVYNAFNRHMFGEILNAVQELEANDKIRVIIMTGIGKAFSVGGDLKEIVNMTYSEGIKRGLYTDLEIFYNCAKPIIAAVNGITFGGGFEFILMCDIVYASETAIFRMLEVKNGIICGGGATQRLPKAIGKSKAMEIVLTGCVCDAHEAKEMGFVNRVFPENKVLEESIKLAEKIATHSPEAVRMAKRAVNMAYETSLKTGLQYERMIKGNMV